MRVLSAMKTYIWIYDAIQNIAINIIYVVMNVRLKINIIHLFHYRHMIELEEAITNCVTHIVYKLYIYNGKLSLYRIRCEVQRCTRQHIILYFNNSCSFCCIQVGERKQLQTAIGNISKVGSNISAWKLILYPLQEMTIMRIILRCLFKFNWSSLIFYSNILRNN